MRDSIGYRTAGLLVAILLAVLPAPAQTERGEVAGRGKPVSEWLKSKRQQAREEAAKRDSEETKSPDQEAYAELVSEAKLDTGLVVTIRKEEKLYFEVPDSLLGRPLLFTDRLSATSDPADASAGEMRITPFLATLEAQGKERLLLRLIPTDRYVDRDDPIRVAFERNNLRPIARTFEVVAQRDVSRVIDVTNFFLDGEALFEQGSPYAASKGSPIQDAGLILSAKAFERNVEVESRAAYSRPDGFGTYQIHRSMVLLPDRPMKPRRADSRVGYFTSPRSLFSSSSDRIEKYEIIHRWRLEPSDSAAYARGEVVDPVQPIVFYIDTAFPPKWRGAIKAGIEDWEPAFRAAGFSHAIRAEFYPSPEERPDFDPEDLRFSCVKYAASEVANAMGPSYIDPRSGEILCGDVIWYHGITSLLYLWRFVQTAAADQRVRQRELPDSLMCEAMRYVAAHEIGHTLGLAHNMGASHAYAPEQLRDPDFTRQYGTTPSIMDYARFNYIAQPGDLERGVSLLPPLLGPYDRYAIEWGYRCYPADEERQALRTLIEAHAGDPMYTFGPQQMTMVDPTAQTEDLSNDPIRAGDYGLSNLRFIAARFEHWLEQPGETMEELTEVYGAIIEQALRYLRHVTPLVGARIYCDSRQGDGTMPVSYLPAERQREALRWCFAELRALDDWLFTPYLLQRYGSTDYYDRTSDRDYFYSLVLADLTEGYRLLGVIEGSEAVRDGSGYRLEDYLEDYVTELLRVGAAGEALSRSEQALQRIAIDRLASYLPLTESRSGTFLREAEEWALRLPGTPPDAAAAARMNLLVPDADPKELAPYLRIALTRVRSAYRSRLALTNDAVTRAYYREQELLLGRLLDKP